MGVYMQAARRQSPRLRGEELAGLARELRANAMARRRYRQEVLGIQDVRKASRDQLRRAEWEGALPGGDLSSEPLKREERPQAFTGPAPGLAAVLDAAATKGSVPLQGRGPAGSPTPPRMDMPPVVAPAPAMTATGGALPPSMTLGSGGALPPGPGLAALLASGRFGTGQFDRKRRPRRGAF